jgi:hypothetical protein
MVSFAIFAYAYNQFLKVSATMVSVIAVSPGEPSLHLLRQRTVSCQNQKQPHKRSAGQRHHPEIRSETREGIANPTAIMAPVNRVGAHEARLCRNGILAVRIKCTTKVCESRPFTNQADWNKDCCAGSFAPNRNHIRQNVA